MNCKWWIAGSVLGVGLLGLAQVVAQRSPAAQLAQANGWHANYDTALAEARRTGKPIMLVFRCEP